MLATRLVQLIESHAGRLSEGLLLKLQNDPNCADLRKVAPQELNARSYEIYHNLGDWLLGKTRRQLEQVYVELGERRARQGVTFSHFLYAITATKEQLWQYLECEGLVAEPVELFGEMELFRLVDQFFDRALYHAAVGYERVHHRAPVAAA